jgi:two-component system, chemotaxis family, chemotaxis protein CheY
MGIRAPIDGSNSGESAAFSDKLRSTAQPDRGPRASFCRLLQMRSTSFYKICAVAKTVLIADDNAYIRHTLCELFQSQADFDVCGEAENGKEAIEKAQELDPDLIVLDLSMPVMNGLDAARVLKGIMPRVPLIMFSEYSEVFSEQEARSVGISTLISKSEHISVLMEKARSLLYRAAA